MYRLDVEVTKNGSSEKTYIGNFLTKRGAVKFVRTMITGNYKSLMSEYEITSPVIVRSDKSEVLFTLYKDNKKEKTTTLWTINKL